MRTHKSPSFLEDVVASTLAGCASTVAGHPLDTIKVHQQTYHAPKPTHHVAKSLNVALFRGMASPLANAIIMNTLMFSVFSHVKKRVSRNDDSVHSSTVTASLTAGLASGIATACVSTPTDYVKIQAQLRSVSSFEAWRLTTTPVSNVFRGHLPNLGREAIFTTVYLGLYDIQRPEGFAQVAATSSATGALAWIVSYPFDTIKTRMQASIARKQIREVCRELYRNGGYRAFYRGCAASTGRAMLVTSTRMIAYEWTIARLKGSNSTSTCMQ